METKPIVTSHGNQVLFSDLHKALLEYLPKEAAEWRRSYGRPPRNVYLEASFVPYDDDILPDDTDKTLISRPYFHIFWTDCDLETYKVKVKEEIGDWTAALKGKGIPDWMIVVVNPDENKVKSKLLPRSSVYDKIKSDFCSKHSDRIVVLTDTQKPDQKCPELWSSFLSKLRQALLHAFTRHLQKYEDNMRALREKRNEVGWNFQQYFIVQEELAFMFEMLELYDDAMIQYDELDALFTQFVLNHASGQSVPWLASLIRPCKVWAGLSLQKAIAWERRNLIKDNEATLLEFRNYLFSRQCAVLLLMKKPGEIVKRAIDYLHETVQEVKTLGLQTTVEIGEGGLDCWVFLSGLEVLQRCEAHIDTAQPRTQALNTAYLWDYVCRKLHQLGELCGLMPDSTQKPTSEQLARVVDLTSGMGLDVQDDDSDDESENKKPSPRDKLREALSSRESFQRIYLEQSELAMGTFKHIGRFRSARMIGSNLAHFYMKLGEPQKAENFLLDAMTGYHKEGWKQLRDRARLDLARCQLQVSNHHNRYIKTGCQVASSDVLGLEDRSCHMTHVLDIAREGQGGPFLLKASPLLKMDITDISESKVTIDQQFIVQLKIFSNAPCDLSCENIWLTFSDCTPEVINTRLSKLKTPVSRQSSNSSLDGRNVMNLSVQKKNNPAAVNIREHFEEGPDELITAGISCVNSHEVLKRNDSTGPCKSMEEKVVKDNIAQRVNIEGVVLKPGDNVIKFVCEGITAGHYKPGQVGVKVNQLELICDLTSDLTVTVVCEEPVFEVIPDGVLAGKRHDVTIRLHTGSIPVDPGSKVKVLPSGGLDLDSSHEDNMVVLKGASQGSTLEWNMSMLQEPRVNDGKQIENKIAFDCSWLPRPILTRVTFQNPFSITHKLHTAREMKFIQVQVNGQSDPEFIMTEWALEVTNTKDVELIRLNRPDHSMKINIDQNASCVWQLKWTGEEAPPLDLVFTMHYRCLEEEDTNISRQLTYKFTVASFQTLYTVKTDISPKADDKFCKTGSLAVMKVQVLQMPVSKPLGNQDLMYEVLHQSDWTLHGKSTGVFSTSGGTYSTSLEVMPLVCGFIPLPQIRLYKYNGVTVEKDIWLKKADLEKLETFDSTDEDSSETEADQRPIPTHSEFDQGQVYYSSLSKQVHVYPERNTGDIEITLA